MKHLFNAEQTGLLNKSIYSAVANAGLNGAGTLEQPYLPLTGDVGVTCLAGYRFVTEDFYNSLKPGSRENFPLNNFAKNEHLHTDMVSGNFDVVTSVDGGIKLNYDNVWG